MIIHGDCLKVMRTYSDNHFTNILTDPPYGLSFMNKAWDQSIPGKEYWVEALRICKPGAMMLCFGGTRTYHRLACAIEDAGWEIRDCLMWIYGSGFPKSLDISKSLDKQRNDDVRPVCRFLRKQIENSNISIRQLANIFQVHPRMIEHWAAKDTDSQPLIPNMDYWKKLKEILAFSDEMCDYVFTLNSRKYSMGENALSRGFISPTGSLHLGSGNTVGCYSGKQLANNPISDLSKQFQGYGTALKPAYEPIIMAMKPLNGTFSKNAEKWDTAGINIEISRIDGIRWPANVLFDEESSQFFDDHTDKKSRFFYCAKASSAERNEGLDCYLTVKYTQDISRGTLCQEENMVAVQLLQKVIFESIPSCSIDASGENILVQFHQDFSSIIKTKTKQIIESKILNSLMHLLTNEYIQDANSLKENGGNLVASVRDLKKWILDITSGKMELAHGASNAALTMLSLISEEGNWKKGICSHPTVKPIKLLEYLLKLIAPPKNALILDPFVGSGTTCIAAKKLGLECIGIEISEEYCEIARKREESVQLDDQMVMF